MNKAISEQKQDWDAIVVGGGLGGLASAACLAALGKRPLLLERYAVLGGSSHVFHRQKKWEFDCGVHYVGDCGPEGPVPTLLRGLGLNKHVEWLPLDHRSFDTIIGPDLELKVPVGWDHYLENVLRAFPEENEKKLRRYIAIMQRIAESLDRSGRDAGTVQAAVRGALKAGSAARWMLLPHIQLLKSFGFGPRAVMALSVQEMAVASTPQVMPTAMAAMFLQDYIGGGAWYPRGGGQMLAAGFADVVRTHGGTIRTKTHVDRILVENGKVTGVRLASGEELRSSIVVAAGDIKRTYKELIGYENLPRWAVRRNERWKMGYPTINGYFGVEIDIQKTPNSNYFVIPNWDDASSVKGLNSQVQRLLAKAPRRDPLQWARDYARNQTGFVQCSTRRDPRNTRSAPKGHSAIEVQSIAPSDPALWGFAGYDVSRGSYRKSTQYQEIKEIILEGFQQRLQTVYPNAVGKIRLRELGSPASQERFTYTSNGAAFGLEPRLTQFGPFRPGVETPIRGLFHAGASTIWGPGTVGAMLSGVHAVSAIAGRDLLTEFQQGTVIAQPSRLSAWGEDFDPLRASRSVLGQGRDEDDEWEQEAAVIEA